MADPEPDPEPKPLRGPSGDILTDEQVARYRERWAAHAEGPRPIVDDDGIEVEPWTVPSPVLEGPEAQLEALQRVLETIGERQPDENIAEWAIRLLTPAESQPAL